MFSFTQNQEFDKEQGFITCSHLRDFATELGVDTDCAFGLSADMEQEQLTSIQQVLQAAIDAEIALRERNSLPICNIGPYEAGICTICGGRQP